MGRFGLDASGWG